MPDPYVLGTVRVYALDGYYGPAWGRCAATGGASYDLPCCLLIMLCGCRDNVIYVLDHDIFSRGRWAPPSIECADFEFKQHTYIATILQYV